MTYYNSIQYTNFSMVTEWYVAGNEIADHTMTHVGDAPSDEIIGNAAALNAFAGIPQSSLQGFRAPFLNYSNEMLQRLSAAQFLYDSSATSTIPVTDPNNDAWWPYTLDYGLANDCLSHKCGDSGPKIAGLWEVPMYAIYDERGAAGAHMMDPWLDAEVGGNTTASLTWMTNAFDDHYQRGTRQPFGIYTHPTHFATGIPGQPTKPDIPRVINRFLDYAQQQDDVWVVTTAQLVAWMRNPVPAAQLNTLPEFQCQTPQVDSAICNGIPANEAGLLSHCTFEDFPWHTCYGCPVTQPTVNQAVPPQDTSNGQQARFRLPANCSTAFWDPIGGKCLCNDDKCKFTDVTKPIGPNGSNLTSGGTGAANSTDDKPEDPYKPFGEDGAMGMGVALGAVVVAALGWVVAL